jgi:hypothetical protein
MGDLERQVTKAKILMLFAFAGVTVWGCFCQRSLRDWRMSLKELLALIVTAAVAIQLGLLVLEAYPF